jgi:hypothetical protein
MITMRFWLVPVSINVQRNIIIKADLHVDLPII